MDKDWVVMHNATHVTPMDGAPTSNMGTTTKAIPTDGLKDSILRESQSTREPSKTYFEYYP